MKIKTMNHFYTVDMHGEFGYMQDYHRLDPLYSYLRK